MKGFCRLCLLVLGTAMAQRAEAQFPFPKPLPEQVMTENVELRRLVDVLRKDLATASASVSSCDSLRRLDFDDFEIINSEKDKRIALLNTEANGRITAENSRANQYAVDMATLLGRVKEVQDQVSTEALTSRPLGFGRKQAVIKIRAYIIDLLTTYR